jgi:DNA-binding protein WhiA
LLLAAGSVSRPDGPAHVELLMGSAEAVRRTLADLERIGIPARAVRRRGRQVVEVRSVAGLATLLSSVGAPQARLELEAGRVVGEVRSAVSRQLNAEIANLRRSAEAAVIQIEAIDRLRHDGRSWDALPPALREAADVRRRHPQATLESLAAGVGCSRSAMAGRLHRLVIAGSR